MGCNVLYNTSMPTPFYHIHLANKLLSTGNMPDRVTETINAHLPAFYFGNIAPDVQSIIDRPRYDTHFYRVNGLPQPPAEQKLFSDNPSMNRPDLPAEQKIFMAGYCCHLQADQVWIRQIFQPYFGMNANWRTLKHRLYIHNVFRTWLDITIFPSILENGRKFLKELPGENLLPFLDDTHLEEWREYIYQQFKMNSELKTAKIFAKRMNIDPKDFLTLLESENRMEKEVFSQLPEDIIETYKQTVMKKNELFLIDYLAEI